MKQMLMNSNTKVDNSLVTAILNKLFAHRRIIKNCGCKLDLCEQCCMIVAPKLVKFMEQGLPLHFILPAFPAKSANPNKTLGPLPDLGETMALQFLHKLCEVIQAIYPPGASITICSDGRVFNDLVQVTDFNVSRYQSEIEKIIKQDHLNNINLFNLEDYFSNVAYKTIREKLLLNYSESIAMIRKRTKDNVADKMLFNGIHRFIFEDQLALVSGYTKSQLRKRTKAAAYQVIQRSNAWGKLLENRFPDSIRLSIHPQFCASKKLGISFFDNNDLWATPWHNVVLFDGVNYRFVKKIEAEKCGAKLILKNNRPSHFVLESKVANK